MSEQIIFKHDGVLISSNRLLIAGKQTHLLGDITSTRIGEMEPNQIYAIIVTLIGTWLITQNGVLVGLGCIALMTGVIIWISSITQYAAFINTPKDEYRIFISNDRLRVEKLVNALDLVLDNLPAKVSEHITPSMSLKRLAQAIVP
jgi:hypothetical protein